MIGVFDECKFVKKGYVFRGKIYNDFVNIEVDFLFNSLIACGLY
jgi:hypothetical protein